MACSIKPMVVAGGVIPEKDRAELEKAGCAAVFGPGTSVPVAADRLMKLLMEKAP